MPDKKPNSISESIFDTQLIDPEKRLAAFQDLTAKLYKVSAKGDSHLLQIYGQGYAVGDFIFNKVDFSPVLFQRNKHHLRGKDQDFLILEWMIEGEQKLFMEHCHVHMKPGHIYLRDWSNSFEADATTMSLYSIHIPRNRLKASQFMNVCNPVYSWSLEHAAGRSISLLWHHLFHDLSTLSLSEARNLTEGLLGYIDGLLGYGTPTNISASLEDINLFISTRLQGEISNDLLCEHFKISRSTLYRIYEPLGGVKHYISQQRLRHCYKALCDADPAENTINEIASYWGFNQPASFTRLFKKTFQATPSSVFKIHYHQAKSSASEDQFSDRASYKQYHEWFHR